MTTKTETWLDISRPGEEWRWVVGYEGRYYVSNQGRVISIMDGDRRGNFHRETPLVLPASTSKGYRRVALSGPKRTARVARLVLEAFAGPCPDGMQAAHENGNSRDDRFENLSWKTQAENNADKVRHGTSLKGGENPSAVVSEDDVLDMRCRAWSGESYASIARDYPVSDRAVSMAVRGLTWGHTLDADRLALAKALREVTR